MRRKIIPVSRRDRTALAMVIIVVLLTTVAVAIQGISFIFWLGVAAVFLGFVDIYVLQDQEQTNQVTDYSKMIELLSNTGATLGELKAFLEREQKRVAETQRTLEQLEIEKQQLEPVVRTQREVVEAILAAQSKRSNSNKWKEWIMAFSLGILSSLLATYLFQLLQLVKK